MCCRLKIGFRGALLELRFGDDVELPAGELRGQADVLPLAADRERELIVFDHDLHRAIALVDADRRDFRGRQRRPHENHGVVRPRDDVDLLALELLNHVLHANALHADASADRIHVAILRDDRDLGTRARLAGAELDLDDLLADLRDFHFEELHQIARARAREIELRTAVRQAHVREIGLHAVARLELLARDDLGAGQEGVGLAEVDHHVAALDTAGDAGDDLAFAVNVLVVDDLAFGIADLLEDDLLGGLRVDAAEVRRPRP